MHSSVSSLPFLRSVQYVCLVYTLFFIIIIKLHHVVKLHKNKHMQRHKQCMESCSTMSYSLWSDNKRPGFKWWCYWTRGYKIEWSYKKKTFMYSTSIKNYVCYVCVVSSKPTTTSNSTWHVRYKLICAQKLRPYSLKCV